MRDEASLVSEALAGDPKAFEALVSPHRRAITAHGYRMLGSIADAEDVAQETLVRAWKALAAFEGRSSVRSWLYRIATNVAIDVGGKRPPRGMPDARSEPQAPGTPLAAPVNDPVWLDPAPAAYWQDEAEGPEAKTSARESVGIAFMTAIQRLPPLQRAVLLLRDVLGFSAQETAELVESTVPAVNSALQRARATMEDGAPNVTPTRDEQAMRELLSKYVSAWEAGTTEALTAVLRDDAVLTMPPIPSWFRGARAIAAFYAWMTEHMGPSRFVATEASGAPALAAYVRRKGARVYEAAAINVLDFDEAGRVRTIHAFLTPERFATYGLAATLE